MVRPNSDYFLFAEGYYSGFEDNGGYDDTILPKMQDYLKSLGCPDDVLLEIIDTYTYN